MNDQKKKEPLSSSEEVSSEEEGEDLILEGVLVRNNEVSSSDESEDEEEVQPKKKKAKVEKVSDKPKKKQKEREPEIIPVEFTFNDANEKYFHGIKNYLLSHHVYAPHSSSISDLIIKNVSVGTIVSSDDGEDNVFGFASVLNVKTYNDEKCFQAIKTSCLEFCPKKYKTEMETVLSGKTKRPAGFFVHSRMVNVPLEITLVLHEQLVLDMDWAVDNAEGGEDERKSLNFGAFVILAPCHIENSSNALVYKNFDDEIFAGCAEFTFPIESKCSDKNGSDDKDETNENQFVQVIVMTKTGHREGMKELKKLIHGS
jgi:protein BCP1